MIDPKFIVNLKGREFPTWPGVLDAATRAGLRSLTTRIVQVPAAENGHMAIVLAHAEFEDGRVFEDVGDASPANCSAQIAAAALRMASTRAKGRCLRDAINCGATLFEELPDAERAPAGREETFRKPAPPFLQGRREPADTYACEGCGQALREAQAVFSRQHFSRSLCVECRPAKAGR